jgi:hypothetical protein
MPKKNLEKKIKEGEDEIVERLKSIKENERRKTAFDLQDIPVEDKFKSINFQPIKPDSWNDNTYMQKHLSKVNTQIVLPKLSKNINFNIMIEKDGKLILAPGTDFTFGASNSITSNGKLIIEGEYNNHIKLTNYSGVMPMLGKPSAWDKFSHAMESRESVARTLINVYGSSPECVLKHCDLYGKNINISNAKLIMKSCKVDRSYSDGGVKVSNSDIDIDNNNISGSYNQYFWGGGIELRSCKGKFNNNDVHGNRAKYGGGVHIDKCTLDFNDNLIKGNIAEDTFSAGGGMYLQNSYISGNNNFIEKNMTDGDGGGIEMKDSSFYGYSNQVINNTANQKCGGIKVVGMSSHDCIEIGNTERNMPFRRY